MKRLLLATAMLAGLSAPAFAQSETPADDLHDWALLGTAIGLAQACGLITEGQMGAAAMLAAGRKFPGASPSSDPEADFPSDGNFSKADGEAFLQGWRGASQRVALGAVANGCAQLQDAMLYLAMFSHHGYY